MTQEEIKQFIADKTNEGMALSAIQDALAAQGVKLRFMELRMLAAEIESVLAKKESEKAPPPEPEKEQKDPAAGDAAAAPADAPAPAADAPAGIRGKTTVTISPMMPMITSSSIKVNALRKFGLFL